MDGVDTPQTATTTSAPAVLKNYIYVKQETSARNCSWLIQVTFRAADLMSAFFIGFIVATQVFGI